MSRAPFASLVLACVLTLSLSSCVEDRILKVHYPKLNWKNGGTLEARLWNQALGTSLNWETRIARVSNSPSGTAIGPRCAISKVPSAEFAELNRKYRIYKTILR